MFRLRCHCRFGVWLASNKPNNRSRSPVPLAQSESETKFRLQVKLKSSSSQRTGVCGWQGGKMVDLNYFRGMSFIVQVPRNKKSLCLKYWTKIVPVPVPGHRPTDHTRSLETESKPAEASEGKKQEDCSTMQDKMKQGSHNPESSGTIESTAGNGFYRNNNLLFLTAFGADNNVSSCLRADQALQRELLSFLSEDEIFRSCVCVCDQGASIFTMKGFFVPWPGKKMEQLEALRERFPKTHFRMTRLDQPGVCYVLQGPEMSAVKFYLESSEETRPEYHPLYMSEKTMDYNSVYHHYEDAMKILGQNLDIPEVVQLLEIAQNYIDPTLSVEDLQSRIKHPFIVIEGLDATGKSTLTKNLSELLGACQLRTPTDPIRNLRKTFDDLPEILRRAYYSLGNYIVAKEVTEKCQEMPVIMDRCHPEEAVFLVHAISPEVSFRFWHSTTAYAIANDCDYDDISNLPPRGHWVYQWPSDLIKPTVVLFLTVSEEVRDDRMTKRNEVLTWEEKKLGAKEGMFRNKLLETYRRMADPPCVEIDASVSKEMVAARSREALEEVGVL